MKPTIILLALCSIVVYSNAGKYNRYTKCKSDFMYDSCPVGSYSVVETERYVRVKHNWMKVGDTLDTDIITGGVGSERHRNFRREEYEFPVPKKYEYSTPQNLEDQHPIVVKSNCDTPQECKI